MPSTPGLPERLLPIALAACLALSACATVRAPSRDDLVGRWTMVSVARDGQDLTAQANPTGDRAITLRADGTFVASGADPNRGRWRYDARAQRLALDSDLGPAEDSAWVIGLVGADRMRWEGSADGARLTIVSVRARATRPTGSPR